MKVIITVAELIQKGKLELVSEMFPDISFSPGELTKEVELNEQQAARLGLVLKTNIGDFPNTGFPSSTPSDSPERWGW